MKARLSYKSKRNIIIAVLLVLIFAATGVGTYFYVKGDKDAQAAGNPDGFVEQIEGDNSEKQEENVPENKNNETETNPNETT